MNVTNMEEWNEMLKNVVNIAFDVRNVPTNNIIHGILDIIPIRGLHTFENGLFEFLISTIINVIGMKNKNNSNKKELDKLHSKINRFYVRTVLEGHPIPVGRRGISNGSKMETSEQRPNLLALIVAMKTLLGQELFTCNWKNLALPETKRFQYLCWTTRIDVTVTKNGLSLEIVNEW